MVIGSIDPWLGSVEGVIYTEITPVAHLFFLTASAIQYGLLLGGLRWMAQRRPVGTSRPEWLREGSIPRVVQILGISRSLHGRVRRCVSRGRYRILGHSRLRHGHPRSDAFALWRPLDRPLIQFAILFQVGRGALLGVLLFPLYGWFFGRNHRWLRLFGGFWAAIYLDTPPAVRYLVAEVLTPGPLADVLFGTAELTVQLLGYSLAFWTWENRRRSNVGIIGRLIQRVTGSPPSH